MHLCCYLECSGSKLLLFHLFSGAYMQIYVCNYFSVELVNRISSLASCYLGKVLMQLQTLHRKAYSGIFTLRNGNIATNESKSVFWTSCCFNWRFWKSGTKCIPYTCIFFMLRQAETPWPTGSLPRAFRLL